MTLRAVSAPATGVIADGWSYANLLTILGKKVKLLSLATGRNEVE